MQADYKHSTYTFFAVNLTLIFWSENARSVELYKYNGKEFIEAHGLDEYYSYFRNYYPAIMRTTTIDPHAENYYGISPYAWAGNNPIRHIDPDGMDYWSTNDPDEIRKFLESINYGYETFDYSSWTHITDDEFTGNLTFNDETNTFFSSYGTVEDGVFTSVGVSIQGGKTLDGGASFGINTEWWEKASGQATPTYEVFDFLLGGATKVGRSLVQWIFKQMTSPMGTTNTFDASKSGFQASGKNDRHGDSGRALTKAEQQIKKLEQQKVDANRIEREKIQRKIDNIKRDAQNKARGEEHSRANKR